MPILTQQVRQLARHLSGEGRITAETLERIDRRTRREDLCWAIAILTLLTALIATALVHCGKTCTMRSSPWGSIQESTPIAPGLRAVSTASHGASCSPTRLPDRSRGGASPS
ncbi:MAG: hypothetical protein HY713_12235 [candidate division NC10 bacterium]|nr:hypothetical protein [candidate division NC10 bacterium]